MDPIKQAQKNFSVITDPSFFEIITLDGGAAAGKSSTARLLAERLNFLHVDTGMHYRALSFLFIENGLSPDNETGIKTFLSGCTLQTCLIGRSAYIGVNEAVLEAKVLREDRINNSVSAYAAIPIVRDFLKHYQRSKVDFAKMNGFNGLVMEGRDIGSVIFPEAKYRFFLHADPVERQKRRLLENAVLDNVVLRDQKDSHRSLAPLVCPEGAIMIDTTHQDLETVVESIVQRIVEGLNHPAIP